MLLNINRCQLCESKPARNGPSLVLKGVLQIVIHEELVFLKSNRTSEWLVESYLLDFPEER